MENTLPLDVLKEADEGTATSLEKTYRSMIDNMCVMLNMVNIDVHEAVKGDAGRKADKHQFVKLKGEDLARAKNVQAYAWGRMQHMKASNPLTAPDLRLLGDEQLVEELPQTDICDMLRVKHATNGHISGKSGLVRDDDQDLCSHHLKVANHYLKKLQAALGSDS